MEDFTPETQPYFLDLLHKAADLSAAAILPYFRQNFSVEDKVGKGVFDPVTDADRLAESAIRAFLQDQLPDHSLLGEEFDEVATNSDFHWIIDPIDGTRAFMMGSPLWGSLIGLCYKNRPVMGLMNQPFTNERFWASPAGAFGRWPGFEGALSTRKTTELADAVITSTCPDLFASDDDRAAFEGLRQLCKMTRYGGDCYHYCLLARGGVDLVVESGLAAYDILPLVPIITGAGGVITDWQGEALELRADKAPQKVIAASTPDLHQKALSVLLG